MAVLCQERLLRKNCGNSNRRVSSALSGICSLNAFNLRDFMITGKGNLWHLWHSSNFGGNWRERGGPHSRELKQRRFWATHVNRKLMTFCILGQWFCANFRANRLYKAKINSNTNLFASRHFKREKASLPFDVHVVVLIVVTHAHDTAVFKFGETNFRPSTYASDCVRKKLLSSLPDSHAQRRSGALSI